MANDTDDGMMTPLERAIITLWPDAEQVSDILVVSGPGYEDFPCSEMHHLHVEAMPGLPGGPLVDGPIMAPVTLEWGWTEDAPDSETQFACATLSGIVTDGVLKATQIELVLEPQDLPIAA